MQVSNESCGIFLVKILSLVMSNEMDEASFQKKIKICLQGFWHKSENWKQSEKSVR